MKIRKREYRSKVLIVDDSEFNRLILKELLQDEYDIIEAENGLEGIEILRNRESEIDIVLLDIVMPEMDGFEMLTAMNRYKFIDKIPVIMISAENGMSFMDKAYKLGASDYIRRPFDKNVVIRRVENTIMLYEKQKHLVNIIESQIYEKEKNNNLLIGVLGHIVEFRNGESGRHVHNIQAMTSVILRHLVEMTDKYRLSESDILMISTASALHDIGKISIDEKILNKPGKLTDEEYEIMKTHTTIGADMLKSLDVSDKSSIIGIAYDICRWHHERYDGKGYPDGLKGDEIPISAQVVALADVYDALTSKRCYKNALPHIQAITMIKNGECGVFNPLLMQCLTDIEDQIQYKIQGIGENKPDKELLSKITKNLIDFDDKDINEKNSMEPIVSEWQKMEFFTSGLKEIQIVYDKKYDMASLSHWSAQLLGLNQVIINPYNHKVKFFSNDIIKVIADWIHSTTPQNRDIKFDFLENIVGEVKKYTFMARSLWDTVQNEYTGVMVRIFRSENKKSILISAVNSISTDISENIDGITDRLKNIFYDVKLIDGSNIEDIEKLKENGIEVRLAADKNKLYQLFRKYTEINGKPNVIEMKYDVKCNSGFDMVELKVIAEFEEYNRIMFRDALTGVYNRKYYDMYTDIICREKYIALIRFNNLSDINKKYGYEKGSDMLCMLAKIISENIRKDDIVIRYKGNMFILVLENISTEMLKNKLDLIKEKAENLSFDDCRQMQISAIISKVSGTGRSIAKQIENIAENMADL